jgi:hypothetical protein
VNFGSARQLDGRARFFQDGNPLVCAMLFHSGVDADLNFNTHDDAAALAKMTFVYETPVDVSGVTCIVLGNEHEQVFCDPKLSFAVVQRRTGEIRVGDTGAYVRSNSYSVLTNSKFHQLSDNGWLPMRSEFVNRRDGAIYEHTLTTFEKYEVSPVGLDAMFTDVISDKAFVADVVNDVTYVTTSANVEKALNSSVSERLVGRSRYGILILVNVVAAILLAVGFFRARKR